MEIIRVETPTDCKKIETLAWQILPAFYAPWLPDEHTLFFLKKFQTAEVIHIQMGNGYEYYLLKQQNKEFGYLGFQLSSRTMLLSKLYLLQQYRSKGYGNEVMIFVIKRAFELNIKKIELIVNRKNEGAIKFYRERGFEITEPLLHKFENGHSVEDYKMTKIL